jgi:hypothetical protein
MRYLFIALLLFIGCDEDSPTALIHGCFDSQACNYNPSASIDNNSCIYADEGYDCDGICTSEIDCLGLCGGNTVEDNCKVCNGDGSSCGFTANIILTNNLNPVSNADVFIKYDCPEHMIENESCIDDFYESVSLFRSSQTIYYEIPSSGQVKIDMYNLDNNLIANLIDEYQDAGSYNESYEQSVSSALFGLNVSRIVLEHNQQTIEKYSIFDITPYLFAGNLGFSTNLGTTNEFGHFTLDSDFLIYYNIPTLYDIPDIQGLDAQGNPTDFISITEAYANLSIYFLFEGIYKRFDIDLKNANYNYSFEWNDGDIFNYDGTMKVVDTDNNNMNRVTDKIIDDVTPSKLNLFLYPNPFN